MNTVVTNENNIVVKAASKSISNAMTLAAYLRVLLVGTFFGIVLVKSEVVRWQRVHDMFLFKEPHMYLIIGTGIFVAAISMLLIKRYNVKTVTGEPITYKPKPFQKGVIFGGMLFGAGWAITGACPGPIYAQIGSGVWMSLLTLLGAIAGMYAYAYAKPKLPSSETVMPFIIIGALIIGLMLGLMGSGGSILTIPVLVYMLGHDGKVAIAESLAIVGGIALASMLPYARSHLVNWRNVFFFGIPGMVGTYFGAWLSHYVASAMQLTLFAVVMLIAAVLMFRNDGAEVTDETDSGPATSNDNLKANNSHRPSFWKIGLEGLIVGIITGLVGVGGGFLIVPALTIFGKLPMRVAIGTSLAIIAMKSFSGFYKYLDVLESVGASIDWPTVVTFVLIGMIGSLVGHAVATRLNQAVLRKAFAVFLVGMGLFVMGKEGPKLLSTSPSSKIARPPVLNMHAAADPTTSLPKTILNENHR